MKAESQGRVFKPKEMVPKYEGCKVASRIESSQQNIFMTNQCEIEKNLGECFKEHKAERLTDE